MITRHIDAGAFYVLADFIWNRTTLSLEWVAPIIIVLVLMGSSDAKGIVIEYPDASFELPQELQEMTPSLAEKVYGKQRELRGFWEGSTSRDKFLFVFSYMDSLGADDLTISRLDEQSAKEMLQKKFEKRFPGGPVSIDFVSLRPADRKVTYALSGVTGALPFRATVSTISLNNRDAFIVFVMMDTNRTAAMYQLASNIALSSKANAFSISRRVAEKCGVIATLCFAILAPVAIATARRTRSRRLIVWLSFGSLLFAGVPSLGLFIWAIFDRKEEVKGYFEV